MNRPNNFLHFGQNLIQNIIILFFLIMLFSGCMTDSKDSVANSKPNILIMMADDTGWNDVGYHGSEIKTPNIDKLALTGVELDRFYAYPTCSPTRAALLTGRNPSRFGILGPIAMKSKQILPADGNSLAEMLQKKGYATAITGKWHLGLRPENGPRQYGFEYTYGYLHGQIDQYTHEYKNGDRSWHRNDVFIDEEGHATDLITNEAIKFITEIRDKTKPFFLYVPFSVPHYPVQEADKWIEPYNSIKNESRRKYAASMTHMDDAIGQLIKTLDKENLRENTLVIFISDNGGQENWTPTFEYKMKHGPNDRLGNNQPLRDWKSSLYEGGVRVPGVINWPARLSAKKLNQVISVNDIFQTAAFLAGQEADPMVQSDGINIWSFLSGIESDQERLLYWRTNLQLAIRKGEWKLVHQGPLLSAGENELYNLTNDPLESINVADDNQSIVKALFGDLKEQINADLGK